MCNVVDAQILASMFILSERRGFLRHVAASWMRVRDVKHQPGSSGTARKEENAEQQTNKQNSQWLRYCKATLEPMQSVNAKLEKLEQQTNTVQPKVQKSYESIHTDKNSKQVGGGGGQISQEGFQIILGMLCSQDSETYRASHVVPFKEDGMRGRRVTSWKRNLAHRPCSSKPWRWCACHVMKWYFTSTVSPECITPSLTRLLLVLETGSCSMLPRLVGICYAAQGCLELVAISCLGSWVSEITGMPNHACPNSTLKTTAPTPPQTDIPNSILQNHQDHQNK